MNYYWRWLLVWLGTCIQLHALPSLTNKCGEKGINLSIPNKSDIVAFDKECTTAYIGPPATGVASVAAFSPSANLSFCPSVKSLPNVVNRIVASYDFWLEELNRATLQANGMREQYNEQHNKLIELEEEKQNLEDELVIYETEFRELLMAIREAKDGINECYVLRNSEDCLKLESNLLQLKQTYASYKPTHITPRQERLSHVTLEASVVRRKLDRLKVTIEEQTDNFETYRKRLRSLRNEAMESYAVFGNLEGMTAQILFESGWQNHIEAVKRANPRAPVHIAALPITRSTLLVDLISPKRHDITVPATLIYASIPGFAASGAHGALPSGDVAINDLAASTQSNGAMTSGVSGRIVLSLVGSCPLTNENSVVKSDLSFDDLSAHVTINTINEYPMKHERRHRVTFRASRFAEEIEKRTEKGGFFHTDSVHDIERASLDEDDFHVEFEVEPGMPEYTEEEKAILKLEAKREILDRVLREIGVVHQLSAKKPAMPLDLRQSGAGTIYKEAQCFGWIYCSAATFVIGVLDSIFGRKDAVANFKAKNEQRVTHTYSDIKPATYSFTTTFSKRD